MFAPDVYSTFRGMSEGMGDGSMYRGEVSTYGGSSFPYSMEDTIMRGSDEYRGKKMQVVQVTNHDDLIRRFLQIPGTEDNEEAYMKSLKDSKDSKDNHDENIKDKIIRDLRNDESYYIFRFLNYKQGYTSKLYTRKVQEDEWSQIISYFTKKYNQEFNNTN